MFLYYMLLELLSLVFVNIILLMFLRMYVFCDCFFLLLIRRVIVNRVVYGLGKLIKYFICFF